MRLSAVQAVLLTLLHSVYPYYSIFIACNSSCVKPAANLAGTLNGARSCGALNSFANAEKHAIGSN
jgi:hypothetical protein